MSMEKFSFLVSEEEAGRPLKKVIRKKFHFSSRLMTKIKYQDLITLNGKTVPGWTEARVGDQVSISLPEEVSGFPPEDIPIRVLYEDEDLLFIDKQAGVTVHPTHGHPDHTIANGLMKYMADTGQSFKIRFVNRLDMDTSGVLVCAKNSHAQAELNKQMAANLTEKHYQAFLSGIIPGALPEEASWAVTFAGPDTFTVKAPIGLPGDGFIGRAVVPIEDGGQESITIGKVLEHFPAADACLVELSLLTGRTHQIRVHMSYFGHPLLGDALYGGPTDRIARQALHACSFSCLHPVTGAPLSVSSPLPDDLQRLLEELRH